MPGAVGASVCVLPKPGVHVYSLAKLKLDQWASRGPQVWAGVSGGRRVHAGFGGTHECGASMGHMCECCMFAASTELDQPVSRGVWGGQGVVPNLGS